MATNAPKTKRDVGGQESKTKDSEKTKNGKPTAPVASSSKAPKQ